MSFLKKKMSQNDWATILPFGRVTLIFYWPKKYFSGQPKASPHFRHCSQQELCHGEQILIFKEVCFVLDQHA